ncbi:hypothetical protein DBV15_00543 [Temnothorax longispinosus]|uniref:Uncharacterized protein n=1 Tax=Temnothorax longispinosus TaxID=300112 RepID=A0A4S2KT42_9HYME|nr:hypothetical protein DBV15_00543 [Temnothorax longispinosus]
MARFANPRYLTLPWTPSSIISRSHRAEWRCMYFIHGLSLIYNYEITGNMFLHKSEMQSEDRGVIQVRPLDDPTDEFVYPLFSNVIRSCHMIAIRHARDVIFEMDALQAREEEEGKDQDETTVILRFFIVLYATWAYSRLVAADKLTTDQIDEMTKHYFNTYERAFRLESFLKEYETHPTRECRATMRDEVRPEVITQAILNESNTNFARIARMVVRITDERRFATTLTDFIRDNVDVFPLCVVRGWKDYYAWGLVKKDSVTDQAPVTLEHVRRELKIIRQDNARGRRQSTRVSNRETKDRRDSSFVVAPPPFLICGI